MNVFFKKYQNLVREPVERIQFERFEKHASEINSKLNYKSRMITL